MENGKPKPFRYSKQHKINLENTYTYFVYTYYLFTFLENFKYRKYMQDHDKYILHEGESVQYSNYTYIVQLTPNKINPECNFEDIKERPPKKYCATRDTQENVF